MSDNKKRIAMKHKHPNPLFEQWLTEWRDKAKEQDSKMQHCFSLALRTLKQYPLPLETGKDCKILKGFGDKLCRMLDDKLKKHRLETEPLDVNINNRVKQKKVSTKENKKEYTPQPGSGAFAILVTLYEKSADPNYIGYMTKQEIIESGQKLCNVSFSKAGPDSYYTGWSSMRTLLDKELVHKQGHPGKFSLTPEGSLLADKLYVQQKIEEFTKQEERNNFIENATFFSPSKEKPSSSKTDVIEAVETNKKSPPQKIKTKLLVGPQTSSESSQSSTKHECAIAAPNSFTVILLVDTQELNGSKGDVENDPIVAELKNLGVCFEVRNLKVGDYTWICRDTFGNEMVLPYIIERKRMDDLGQSIKDTRFLEQKFRLKQSGIPNLIYLIESYGRNEHVGLPINTLYQAAVNTFIHDGFIVKFTHNNKASCEYLETMTTFLTNIFKTKTLVSCPKEDLPELTLDDDLIHLMLFKDFNKSSSKSKHFKVTEMFVRHLLQISGMSVDKALAIVEQYPTPKILKLSYVELDEAKGEKLLSTIHYGPFRKNLGPVLSKTVYQFFSRSSY